MVRRPAAFQLPAAVGFAGSVVSWIDATATRRSAVVGPGLLHTSMSANLPARRPSSHPLRRNTEGFYWFGQLRQHVWYESMEEYTALMRLDHRSRVVAVVTQPMRIDFAEGGAHFPDIFIEYADSRQELCNVRPAALIDEDAERQFERTAAICAEIGWTHRVLPEVSPIERKNLEWLSGYRHPRHAPSPRLTKVLLDATEQGSTFGELWGVCQKRSEPHPLAGLYHLLWRRALLFDDTQPLDLDTPMRKAAS